MTPRRVSARGSYQIDRVAPPPVGRILLSRGLKTMELYRKVDDVIVTWVRDGQLEVLAAVKRREITVADILEAKRTGRTRGDQVLSQLRMRKNLWDTINVVMPEPPRSAKTEHRYWVSLKKFAMLAPQVINPVTGRPYLGPTATVADLRTMDWEALRALWLAPVEKIRLVKVTLDIPQGRKRTEVREERYTVVASPSDWMHLRRALSRFLTLVTGDVLHPDRRAVVTRIPTMRERERTPSLTPELFWALVYETPEIVRPSYMTLAITGMRLGEYLACTREHLRPLTHEIAVPGTKTDESPAHVYVDPELWHWVDRAIPAPRKEKWLRTHWKRACRAHGVGRDSDWLHDLRHAFAQFASDAGVTTAQLQAALRHADPRQTRKYEMQKVKRGVAGAVGTALRNARKAG